MNVIRPTLRRPSEGWGLSLSPRTTSQMEKDMGPSLRWGDGNFWRRGIYLLSFALLPLTLSGCGLRPLYAGGQNGAVVQALTGVEVAPIDGGRAGWLVRTALVDRLGQGGTPRYRLEVELDDQITGFGVRSDNAVTRERRTLRARYRLVEGSAVVVDATAGSDAGIDVVSSEYATIAAEQTALERLSGEIADQIVTRLALYAARTAPK